MSFSVVDFFSGAGGSSLGLRWAGFEIIAAVDHDVDSNKTYEENLGLKPAKLDLMNSDPDNIVSETGISPNKVDLLVGCPPCQGFTRLNKNGKNDPRNKLVENYGDFLEIFDPKYMVFENVPRVKNSNNFSPTSIAIILLLLLHFLLNSTNCNGMTSFPSTSS